MYNVTLAKTGTPEGIILSGVYDKEFLNLTFETVEDAGLHLIKLTANNSMEQKTSYVVIKI